MERSSLNLCPLPPVQCRAPAKLVLQLTVVILCTVSAWGALATDAVVPVDQSKASTTITTASFSTTAGNELLLAFISTDAKSAGITVTGVSGANLTWVLVKRTNVQLGTAEIWRAFAPSILSKVTVKATLSQSVAASMTVVSFTHPAQMDLVRSVRLAAVMETQLLLLPLWLRRGATPGSGV